MDDNVEGRNRDSYVSGEETSIISKNMYDIYQAYVDLIIPQTPKLAEKYGNTMFYGAIDFLTEEYLIITLQKYDAYLPGLIAEILEIVAKQVLFLQEKENLLENPSFLEGSVMQKLSKKERLYALSLVEQDQKESKEFALLFDTYPELLSILTSLPKYTMMGYYSEWYGYGTTRLEQPSERVFEFSPKSWEQVGYPGPARGYISELKQYYRMNNRK